MSSKDEYTVGYRKPPAQGQFPPGVSGNPKGRPKHSKNIITLLDMELEQKVTVSENGVKKTVTKREAFVKRMVTAAMQGDSKFVTALLNILKQSDAFEEKIAEDMKPADIDQMFEDLIQAEVNKRLQNRSKHDS